LQKIGLPVPLRLSGLRRRPSGSGGRSGSGGGRDAIARAAARHRASAPRSERKARLWGAKLVGGVVAGGAAAAAAASGAARAATDSGVAETEAVGAPVAGQLEETRAEEILATIRGAREEEEDIAQALEGGGMLVDLPHCVAALRLLRLEGLYAEVPRLFTLMSNSIYPDIAADASAYTEVCGAYEALQRWSSVLDTHAAMLQKGVQPELSCCNSALRAMRKVRNWRQAVQLLESMESGAPAPDADSYANGLIACVTQADLVWKLFTSMKERKLMPSERCYDVALTSLARTSQWEQSLAVFHEMRSRDIVPEQRTTCKTLRGLLQADELEAAKTMLAAFEADAGVELTAVDYDVVISAHERDENWQQVIATASRMGAQGVSPDAITSTTVLAACAELGQWQAAVGLLGNMAADETWCDVSAYAIVLRACAMEAQWTEVLRLYDELTARNPGPLGAGIVTPVIAALAEVGRVADADETYRNSTRLGWLRLWQRFGSGPSFLDARGLYPQMTSVALRVKLEDMAHVSAGASSRGLGARVGLSGVQAAQDLVVIVEGLSFRGDGTSDIQPKEGSSAESVFEVVASVLGDDATVKASRTPYASLRISGSELEALLLKREEEAVSSVTPGAAEQAVGVDESETGSM